MLAPETSNTIQSTKLRGDTLIDMKILVTGTPGHLGYKTKRKCKPNKKMIQKYHPTKIKSEISNYDYNNHKSQIANSQHKNTINKNLGNKTPPEPS